MLLMQDERSKIMNSRAFSCGVSCPAAQQAGNVVLPVVMLSPGSEAVSVTCSPV